MRSRLFDVTVTGRGLWVEMDGRVRRVGFRVARVVEAIHEDEAVAKALALVAADPKTQPRAGKARPDLSVERVVRVASTPAVPAGFMFFPDPDAR